MAITSADIPEKWDCSINGVGYAFYDPDGGKKYGFTDIQSIFQYTPTFVQRSNTQGDFGDEFQDFWMTAQQNDWTLGDGQRFFRSNDEASVRRYHAGTGINISIPGQVNLDKKLITNASLTGSAVAAWEYGGQAANGSFCAYTTSTNLYYISSAGAETSIGAHGLGVAPRTGCRDYLTDYISSAANGTAGVRRYNAGFTTFSATGADSLVFLNNTLYGFACQGPAGTAKLIKYDTAGTASTLFEWKSAAGGAQASLVGMVAAYGGKVLVLLDTVGSAMPNGPELWLYDGVGTFKIAEMGHGFTLPTTVATSFRTPLAVVNGVVYIAANHTIGSTARTVIWYYANGQQGVLWRANNTYTAGSPSACSFSGGLLFAGQASGEIFFYNPDVGSIAQVYLASSAPFPAFLVGGSSCAWGLSANIVDVYFGNTGNPATEYATSGQLITSQFDFGSSLIKIFRGVKVEFDAASSGGSVDISYLVDGAGDTNGNGGMYTSLQVGAASGTEYTFTNITGKTLSIKVTINGDGSNGGPTLKRISVRAAPKQTSKRKTTYVLNLTGVNGVNPVKLRDGTFDANDGLTQATNLASVVTTATPVTVIDELGTYTGVIDNDGFEIRRIAPEEYVATVPIREV